MLTTIMRCPQCKCKNPDSAKNCKKCGRELPKEPTSWSPTWKWHLKTLGIIYLTLIVAYFLINWLLKPYLREIPPEVTPWLKQKEEMHK